MQGRCHASQQPLTCIRAGSTFTATPSMSRFDVLPDLNTVVSFQNSHRSSYFAGFALSFDHWSFQTHDKHQGASI
jgi:hypothetical protein